jgi:hypothetical protein
VLGKPIHFLEFATGRYSIPNSISYAGNSSSDHTNLENWPLTTQSTESATPIPWSDLCHRPPFPDQISATAFLMQIIPPVSSFDEITAIVPTSTDLCSRFLLRSILLELGFGPIRIISKSTALARSFLGSEDPTGTTSALACAIDDSQLECVSIVKRGDLISVEQAFQTFDVNSSLLDSLLSVHLDDSVDVRKARRDLARYGHNSINLTNLAIEIYGGSFFEEIAAQMKTFRPNRLFLAGEFWELGSFPVFTETVFSTDKFVFARFADQNPNFRIRSPVDFRLKINDTETVIAVQDVYVRRVEVSVPVDGVLEFSVGSESLKLTYDALCDRILKGRGPTIFGLRLPIVSKRLANLSLVFGLSQAMEVPDLVAASGTSTAFASRLGDFFDERASLKIKRSPLEELYQISPTLFEFLEGAEPVEAAADEVSEAIDDLNRSVLYDLDFHRVSTAEERLRILGDLEAFRAASVENMTIGVEDFKREFNETLERILTVREYITLLNNINNTITEEIPVLVANNQSLEAVAVAQNLSELLVRASDLKWPLPATVEELSKADQALHAATDPARLIGQKLIELFVKVVASSATPEPAPKPDEEL